MNRNFVLERLLVQEIIFSMYLILLYTLPFYSLIFPTELEAF